MELPFRPDFSGKTAVVTGGSGVLGSGFCRALAACGARVAIVNRSPEKGRVLADSIRADGGEAEAFSADVTDAQSVAQACEAVRAVYGPCEFLVNGAGGNHPSATADEERFSRETPADPPKKGFFDLDPAGFSYVYGLNMTGAFLTTKFFARDMAERGRGAIVNIASVSGVLPLTKAPAYSSAKAAVANFTQWLAVYLGGSGVRVNAIAPGFFPAEQNRALLWNPDGSPTARTGKILAGTPLGRLGRPEELVGALLWLLDDRCSGFVTGAIIPVDGGFTAFSGV